MNATETILTDLVRDAAVPLTGSAVDYAAFRSNPRRRAAGTHVRMDGRRTGGNLPVWDVIDKLVAQARSGNFSRRDLVGKRG
jgi:hypothetical protein